MVFDVVSTPATMNVLARSQRTSAEDLITNVRHLCEKLFVRKLIFVRRCHVRAHYVEGTVRKG